MKNIKFLFLLVATLVAGTFTACQQEWEPGQPDTDLSVYFPVEVEYASFAAVDNDETEIDEAHVAYYPVYRQNGGAEMTVAIRSRMNDNIAASAIIGPAEPVFTIAESVTFAEGETVAYLEILLHEELSLKPGNLFNAEIMVKETKHHGNYGLYRKTIGIGIPETWKNLGDDIKDNNLKMGTFTEDFFTFLYSGSGGATVSVQVDESESRKGYYRMVNLFSKENIVEMLGGVPSDISFAPAPSYVELDARDPKAVYFPYQEAGFSIIGFMEPVCIASGKSIGKDNAVLEDGIISFAPQTVGILDASGQGYLANQNGLMRVTLPGISLVDHSLAVSYDGTQVSPDNSETTANLSFVVGKDVSEFRFVVVEGNEPITTKQGIGAMAQTVYHQSIQNLINDEYEPTAEDNMATATPTQTNWWITLPKAGLYTVFAVPYDKNRQPVMESISRTYFYFRSANMDDAVPEIADMELSLDYVSAFGGDASKYPSAYYLGFDMSIPERSDLLDYVSNIVYYFAPTSEIEAAKAKGATKESILAENGEDGNSWLEDIAAGKGTMLLQSLTPSTSYTMLFSMTSIYGKTKYYEFEKSTTAYPGQVVIGNYKFEDGDSTMNIGVDSIFSANMIEDYGSGFVYLLTMLDDAISSEEEDAEPQYFTFYGYHMPEWNAICCYGEADGYSGYGSLFNRDLDKYNNESNTYWGYKSSSTSDYEYENESFVVYYGEDGQINELCTYFKKFKRFYDKVDNGDGTTKDVVTETTLKEFKPETTVITLTESKMPVVEETPEGGENTGENTEEETEEEVTPSKAVCVGTRTNKTLKMNSNIELIPASLNIQ